MMNCMLIEEGSKIWQLSLMFCLYLCFGHVCIMVNTSIEYSAVRSVIFRYYRWRCIIVYIVNLISSLWIVRVHFGILSLVSSGFFFNFPEYKRWAVKCFIYFTFFVHEIFRIHFYLFCKCEIGIYMQLTQNCDCNSGYWKFNRSKRAVAWNFYSLFAQASFYAR